MNIKNTFGFLLFSTLVFTSIPAKSEISEQELYNMYNRAINTSINDPEHAVELLTKCYNNYSARNDTTMTIECMRTVSEIHRINLNFSKSYDYAWRVLNLAQKYNNKESLDKVYENLGMLYFIFGQHKESEEFLKESLNISKDMYTGDKESGQYLISRYYNLVMLYNQIKDTKLSQAYLDSCSILSGRIDQDSIGQGFLLAEQANIYLIDRDYKKAEALLYDIILHFEAIDDNMGTVNINNKGYLVILYSLMGDALAWQEKFRKATEYYKKGLNAIYEYKAHRALEADFMYKLSDMYRLTDNCEEALKHLYNSKVLNDSIFGSKSIKNSELLEIKNKNREEIEKKNIEIAKKSQELLEKEKHLSRVIMFASIFILLLIVVILYIQNLAQKKRHKLKQDSNNQMLREKNKELTSYTLQFVEKEKIISELIEYIKENTNENSKKLQIIENMKQSRSNYWEEFNKRFISVNQHFYKKLSEKYPELTSTDLKHCALIKLNFSAKEMAHLLGISPSSVHMSHHRLRKKMGLERDVNLSNFISGV